MRVRPDRRLRAFWSWRCAWRYFRSGRRSGAPRRRRSCGGDAQSQPPSLVSELRFGFSAQDPWGPENGSGDVTGEVLFAKPFTPADLFTSYFIPRPHLGGSLNFGGDTSFAYAGLTWTVDITPRVFVEAALGGAVHNGNTSPFEAAFRPTRPLGCSPLFRESGSVGYRLSRELERHGDARASCSNAGACSENRA